MRAAAGSAVRADFRVIAADRFADDDLKCLADTVLLINNFPQGVLSAVGSLPTMSWVYTGSLENEPKLIAAISRKHRLLGNPPEVLRKVRDPFWLEQTLRDDGLPTLRHRSAKEPPPSDQKWLLKPIRSGGGQGICIWNGMPSPMENVSVFQEFRDGQPMSALFLAGPDEVQVVGVCEQLIGREAGAPTEFGYAGSIGPIEVEPHVTATLLRMGELLMSKTGLRGLFGIDFILSGGVPWPVEVNPRYTASVEVLERALRQSLLARHVAVCNVDRDDHQDTRSSAFEKIRSSESQSSEAERIVVGKRIVYATSDSIAPSLQEFVLSNPAFAQRDADQQSNLADIPTPGSRIAAGWPVCTVFASASNVAECRELLSTRTNAINALL